MNDNRGNVAVSRAAGRRLARSFVGLFLLFIGRVPVYAAPTGAATPFIVTAYCQQGITKSGLRTAPGVAAGDRKYLPLGSIVGVEAHPALGDLSVFTVADTGGKVKGRHLDVFTPDCGRAKQIGRRLLQLTVFRWGWRDRLQTPRLTLPRPKP